MVDLVREAVRLVCQELMEAEVTDRLGVAAHERTDDRSGWQAPPRAGVAHAGGGDRSADPEAAAGQLLAGVLLEARLDELIDAARAHAVVADRLEAAEDDLTAFYTYPASHWTTIRSTNPIERFNREIGRRADVVGIFYDDPSVLRHVGMLCADQNDEWPTTRRYLAAHTMEGLWAPAATAPDPEEAPALTAAA